MATSNGASNEQPSLEIVAGSMRARIGEQSGPRVIALEVEGHGELMGSTQFSVDGPLGPVPLIGGHRLWSAPEVRASTYVPDTKVVTSEVDGGVRIESDDARLVLRKVMEVRSSGDTLVIDHTLVNESDGIVEAAAWGLTMLHPGGKVIVPAPRGGLDDDGLQARFAVVTWPYTDLEDPRFVLDGVGITVSAEGDRPFKIGTPNLVGWVGYLVGDILFVKTAQPYDPQARYADLGAAIQVFVGHGFCEIETLSPLRVLSPGESVSHRETWEVRRSKDSILERSGDVGGGRA